MPNVLKHHFAVPRVLVSPIDDHGVGRDIFAKDLFEIHIEHAGRRSSDGFKTFEDAIEVGRATSSSVAYCNDGRSLVAWRSVGSVIVQGSNPIAFPAMLTATEARVGIANGAMIATAQVWRQHWI